MTVLGTSLSFEVLFSDSAGDPGDPDSVRFLLREGVDGSELEWIYDASPTEGTHFPTGMQPIVRASEGVYTLQFVTRKPERHTGVWLGSGTIFQTTHTTAFVRHSELDALEP